MGGRYRVGLIVPSSDVTLESELPELFRRRERITLERFTFHSARFRAAPVVPGPRAGSAGPAALDGQAERCAAELADAECAALAYGCTASVMSAGTGAHLRLQARLAAAAGPRDGASGAAVVTSAGALIEGARLLAAQRIAMITPYPPELTSLVIGYLADAGTEVVCALSLDIADNRAVGRIDPAELLPLISRLDLGRAQALVLSACVQLPSLPVIETAQDRVGLPVLTAATATARGLLDALGLDPYIPGAGALLAGQDHRSATRQPA